MARTVNEQQRAHRRRAITDAAARLFAHRGFANTTTAEIARSSGISTGSLFYHFPDKQAIFRAIFANDIPESRRLFAVHDETNNPVESILEIVDALAAPAREELAPGLMVELLRQAGEGPDLLVIVGENDRIVQNGFTGLIVKAGEHGLVDIELDAEQAARWIRNIIDAAYLNAGNGKEKDPLPMLRLIVSRFLGAANVSTTKDSR